MVTTQADYDELRPRVLAAAEWLDTPGRDKQEIEKWIDSYNKLFDRATQLERMMRRDS